MLRQDGTERDAEVAIHEPTAATGLRVEDEHTTVCHTRQINQPVGTECEVVDDVIESSEQSVSLRAQIRAPQFAAQVIDTDERTVAPIHLDGRRRSQTLSHNAMYARIGIDGDEAISAECRCVQHAIGAEVETVQGALTPTHQSRWAAPRGVDFPERVIARSTLCDEQPSPIVEGDGIHARHIGQRDLERAVGPADAQLAGTLRSPRHDACCRRTRRAEGHIIGFTKWGRHRVGDGPAPGIDAIDAPVVDTGAVELAIGSEGHSFDGVQWTARHQHLRRRLVGSDGSRAEGEQQTPACR